MATRDFLTELLYGFTGTSLPQEYRAAKASGMELDEYRALQRRIQKLGELQLQQTVQSGELDIEKQKQALDLEEAEVFAKSGGMQGSDVRKPEWEGLGVDVAGPPEAGAAFTPEATGYEVAAETTFKGEEEDRARAQRQEELDRQIKLRNLGFSKKREQRLQKRFESDIEARRKAEIWRQEEKAADKQRDVEKHKAAIWKAAAEETALEAEAGSFDKPDPEHPGGGKLYGISPTEHTYRRTQELEKSYSYAVKGIGVPAPIEGPEEYQAIGDEFRQEGPDPFAPPPPEEDYYTVPPGSPIVPNKDLKGEALFEDLKNQIEQSGARNAEDVERMLGPFLTQKLVEYRQAMQ